MSTYWEGKSDENAFVVETFAFVNTWHTVTSTSSDNLVISITITRS
jgi:hypothetical protein